MGVSEFIQHMIDIINVTLINSVCIFCVCLPVSICVCLSLFLRCLLVTHVHLVLDQTCSFQSFIWLHIRTSNAPEFLPHTLTPLAPSISWPPNSWRPLEYLLVYLFYFMLRVLRSIQTCWYRLALLFKWGFDNLHGHTLQRTLLIVCIRKKFTSKVTMRV